jgi:hypothetical protein
VSRSLRPGDAPPPRPATPPDWQRIMAWAGIVLHVGVFALLYLPAGLLAPLWGVGLLWAIWLGLGVLGLRARPRRPLVTAAVPIVAVVAWFAVVFLGGAVLGWSA